MNGIGGILRPPIARPTDPTATPETARDYIRWLEYAARVDIGSETLTGAQCVRVVRAIMSDKEPT